MVSRDFVYAKQGADAGNTADQFVTGNAACLKGIFHPRR